MPTMSVIRIFNNLLNGGYSSSTLNTALVGKTGDWADLFANSRNVDKLFNNTSALQAVAGSANARASLYSNKYFASILWSSKGLGLRGYFSANASEYLQMTERFAVDLLPSHASELIKIPASYTETASSLSSFKVSDDGKLLILNNDNTFNYSPDGGDTWQHTVSAFSLANYGSTSVAPTDSSQFSLYSVDGSIAYVLVSSSNAFGPSVQKIYSSPDFSTWTFLADAPQDTAGTASPTTVQTWQRICVSGGRIVLGGIDGGNRPTTATALVASPTTWTLSELSTSTTVRVRGIFYIDSTFVVIGSEGVGYTSATGSSWTSFDYCSGPTSASSGAGIYKVGTRYVVVGNSGSTAGQPAFSSSATLTSGWSGWTTLTTHTTYSSTGRVTGFAVNGTESVIIGSYTDGTSYHVNIWRSTDSGSTFGTGVLVSSANSSQNRSNTAQIYPLTSGFGIILNYNTAAAGDGSSNYPVRTYISGVLSNVDQPALRDDSTSQASFCLAMGSYVYFGFYSSGSGVRVNRVPTGQISGWETNSPSLLSLDYSSTAFHNHSIAKAEDTFFDVGVTNNRKILTSRMATFPWWSVAVSASTVSTGNTPPTYKCAAIKQDASYFVFTAESGANPRYFHWSIDGGATFNSNSGLTIAAGIDYLGAVDHKDTSGVSLGKKVLMIESSGIISSAYLFPAVRNLATGTTSAVGVQVTSLSGTASNFKDLVISPSGRICLCITASALLQHDVGGYLSPNQSLIVVNSLSDGLPALDTSRSFAPLNGGSLYSSNTASGAGVILHNHVTGARQYLPGINKEFADTAAAPSTGIGQFKFLPSGRILMLTAVENEAKALLRIL